MRICMFARGMAAHRAGSYLWPFEILSRDFAAGGHEVTVLTTGRPDGGAETVRRAGVEVTYLAGTAPEKVDDRYWRASGAAFDALHAKAPFDVALDRGAACWGLLERSRFASSLPLVSHKGTYPAWLHRTDIARWPGRRLTAPVRAVLESRRNPVAARCLLRSSRVVCLTPALERAVRRTLWWRPPQTVCIPYGFDLEAFCGVGPRAAARRPVVTYVGRLTRAKGAEDLLRILASMRRTDVSLEVIGPGDPDYLAMLRGMAGDLGVGSRVSFAGPVPHAALPDRLGAAGAFLLPSTHPEGLSKAVMEAMAMATPVVAYRLPGFEGVIEDGVNGRLVPPRRVDLAAAALDALFDDPAGAGRMGAAARATIARDFSPAAADRAWEALLETVVREHASTAGGAIRKAAA